MFTSNGMYLIILILCILGGRVIFKLKRKSKKKNETEELLKTLQESLKSKELEEKQVEKPNVVTLDSLTPDKQMEILELLTKQKNHVGGDLNEKDDID